MWKVSGLNNIFAPLEGGLPSREPQFLKSLILFVCLFVVRRLAEIYRMASAPATNADFIGFIFQGSQNRTRRFDV